MTNSEKKLIAMKRRWDHECACLVEYVLEEKIWTLDNMATVFNSLRMRLTRDMEDVKLSEVSKSILISLGFERYNANESLMLIPYWYWYLLPDDARVITLDTNEPIRRKNCRTPDIRSCCVRYALKLEYREE